MKHLRFLAILTLALLAAIPALGSSSLLTPDGIRFAVESAPDQPQVEITRAEGVSRARLVVPSTEDATSEKQTQIAFDSVTDTLYVVWTRDSAAGAEIRYATLNAAGEWSMPRNIAAGSEMYRGLQIAVTRSEYGGSIATLLHLSWWNINGTRLEPEYALFGFEHGNLVSAEVTNLEDLAAAGDGVTASGADYEDVGEPIHPPMTMERSGESIDLVFGSVTSSAVTVLNVVPRKIGGDVRIWKPVGRTGVRTPRSSLVSADLTPVQAFIRNGRLALYTVGEHFEYVVLKNNNTWTPVHSVQLDEDNTADALLRDLRAAVEEISDDEEADASGDDVPEAY